MDWDFFCWLLAIALLGSCELLDRHYAHSEKIDCIRAGMEVVGGNCVKRGKP